MKNFDRGSYQNHASDEHVCTIWARSAE